MEFTVDKTLLGDVFRDSALNIEFQPPTQWLKADARMKKVTATMMDSVSRYPISLKEVFYDTASQSVAVLSDLSKVDKEAYNEIISAYEQAFNAGKTWGDVKMASFRFNNLTVDQILLQNQQVVNFKLLFFKASDAKFQIDYIVPREVYVQKIKHIESSIGSIRRVKN